MESWLMGHCYIGHALKGHFNGLVFKHEVTFLKFLILY